MHPGCCAETTQGISPKQNGVKQRLCILGVPVPVLLRDALPVAVLGCHSFQAEGESKAAFTS